MALVFGRIRRGRPDVMFVISACSRPRASSPSLDQNRVIRPNKYFRLFSTTNTIGLGDTTGL